jgi:CubicO group peptidase (beta-lactamase class C family)
VTPDALTPDGREEVRCMTADDPIHDPAVMSGFPPPPELRVRLDQVYDHPRLTHWYLQHVRELSPTSRVARGDARVTELPEDLRDLDSRVVRRAAGGTWTVAEMLRGTCADAVAVLRGGRLVYERYVRPMRRDTTHLCMSVTKSLASCVAANLAELGTIRVDDPVTNHVPELAGSAYGDATIRHLLDMTVGVRYQDEIGDPSFEGARLCRLEGVQPALSDDEPGSAYDFATQVVKEGDHGAAFKYVSLNTVVLGWVMERATGAPMPELLSRHVWRRLGTEQDASVALDGAGSAQLEAGFCCTLRDMARFGQMLCQGGVCGGDVVVPAWWLDDVRRNGDTAAFAAAAEEWVQARSSEGCSYRSCFWVCEADDHTSFSAAGWLGQRVYVNQEAGVVIALFSSRPPDKDDEMGADAFQACEDLARSLADET